MKLYLSGPMTGYPNNNEPAFKLAAATLRGYGYDVVVPHELDETHPVRPQAGWGTYLGRDVEIIANDGIDAIVLLPGWEGSKGARLEAFLGIQLGLAIYEYEGGKSEYGTLVRQAYSSVMFDMQNSKQGVI